MSPMKVSIVIPVYNEEKLLDACLKAISIQTHQPSEVIVVDNGSTDNSMNIARRYRFVELVSEPNRGIVFARNSGFNASTGEIIARIDADSIIPADWVAKITTTFKKNANPHKLAITGPPRFYDTALARFLNVSQVLAYQRFQKLLTGTYVLWGANMAMHRDAWLEVRDRCSQRLNIDEDIDLSFCLHERDFDIHFLPYLPVGASFQRGHLGIKYTATYLSSWPRDYWLHKMYVRSLLIVFLVIIGLVASLPLLLFLRVKSNQQD